MCAQRAAPRARALTRAQLIQPLQFAPFYEHVIWMFRDAAVRDARTAHSARLITSRALLQPESPPRLYWQRVQLMLMLPCKIFAVRPRCGCAPPQRYGGAAQPLKFRVLRAPRGTRATKRVVGQVHSTTDTDGNGESAGGGSGGGGDGGGGSGDGRGGRAHRERARGGSGGGGRGGGGRGGGGGESDDGDFEDTGRVHRAHRERARGGSGDASSGDIFDGISDDVVLLGVGGVPYDSDCDSDDDGANIIRPPSTTASPTALQR